MQGHTGLSNLNMEGYTCAYLCFVPSDKWQFTELARCYIRTTYVFVCVCTPPEAMF